MVIGLVYLTPVIRERWNLAILTSVVRMNIAQVEVQALVVAACQAQKERIASLWGMF
jgi:hypothetical protein